MTETMLQYIRKRIHASSIPEGQLALYDIVYELARRVDALEAARPTTAPKMLYEGEPVLSLAKDNIQLAIEAIEDIRRQYLEVLRLDRCRTIQPGTNIINRLADAQQYLEKLVEEDES